MSELDTTKAFTPQQLAEFRASAISEDVLERSGIFSIHDPKAAAKLLGRSPKDWQGHMPVWVAPYVRPSERDPVLFRGKPAPPFVYTKPDGSESVQLSVSLRVPRWMLEQPDVARHALRRCEGAGLGASGSESAPEHVAPRHVAEVERHARYKLKRTDPAASTWCACGARPPDGPLHGNGTATRAVRAIACCLRAVRAAAPREASRNESAAEP